MKYIIAAIMSVFMTTAVYAQTFFSSPNVGGNWAVAGDVGSSELNPACRMSKTWNDGSSFMLFKDLKDDELYILMQVMDWNISDPPNTIANARMNFHSGSNITGGTATFELLSKNTLRFRALSNEKFLVDFIYASKLVIIMPNNIPNVTIDLRGSSAGVEAMSNCVRAYRSMPQSRPGIKL